MSDGIDGSESTEYWVQLQDGDQWMRFGVYYQLKTAQALMDFLKRHNPLQERRIVKCTTKREVVQ